MESTAAAVRPVPKKRRTPREKALDMMRAGVYPTWVEGGWDFQNPITGTIHRVRETEDGLTCTCPAARHPSCWAREFVTISRAWADAANHSLDVA